MSKEQKPFTLEDQTNEATKEPLFTVDQVSGTPFNIVTKRGDRDDETENQYFVVLGNHRLNPEPFESYIDAQIWAEEVTWEKIMQVISIIAESLTKEITSANQQLEKLLEKLQNDFYNK